MCTTCEPNACNTYNCNNRDGNGRVCTALCKITPPTCICKPGYRRVTPGAPCTPLQCPGEYQFNLNISWCCDFVSYWDCIPFILQKRVKPKNVAPVKIALNVHQMRATLTHVTIQMVWTCFVQLCVSQYQQRAFARQAIIVLRPMDHVFLYSVPVSRNWV